MKRISRQKGLLVFYFLFLISLPAFTQDLTGIWKGYFVTDDGDQYKLEFQVKQNQGVSVSGVSYSYLDVRFYGKATMTGTFVRTSRNFRIKEIRTVEVKSVTGGGTCIMNYNLAYSKSGKEEFLEGTYIGKHETTKDEPPAVWGDCGGGRVFLRRVKESDFYVEPFLRKRPTTASPAPRTTSPPPRRDTTRNKPVVVKPPVRKPVEKPVVKQQQPKDTVIRHDPPPVVKVTPKPVVTTPAILKSRQNELMKALTVTVPEVTVKLYDNGEIDDDTISVYYDKKLIASGRRLSTVPIVLKLTLDDDDENHELVMVAENLGRIPPNTSLMIVEAGEQRFEVRITSTEQKNALVRFRYQKP